MPGKFAPLLGAILGAGLGAWGALEVGGEQVVFWGTSLGGAGIGVVAGAILWWLDARTNRNRDVGT